MILANKTTTSLFFFITITIATAITSIAETNTHVTLQTAPSTVPSIQTGASHSAESLSSDSIFKFETVFRTDENKKFVLSGLKGKKLVMTMVYTSCKSACPLILKTLEKLDAALTEKKIKADFVITTLDTDVDSVERLSHFKHHMDLNRPGWTFLSASEKNTRMLAMLLGIRYSKNKSTGQINHDNKIVLYDEKGLRVRTLEGLSPDLSQLF